MKDFLRVLSCVLLAGCSSISMEPNAVELFSSECEVALTRHVLRLRVVETNRGVVIDEVLPKRRYRVLLDAAEAASIRERIAAFQLSQRDIELMGSREVRVRGPKGEDLVALAPFDGASYRFSIRSSAGVRNVSVHNPASDLHFKGPGSEAARLKEVLDFLEQATTKVRNEKRG